MTGNPKTLNNFTCIPNPSNTPGTNDPLIISDGNEGTLFSTSLLGQEAAVLSVYAATSFTVPASTTSYQLIPGGPDGGTLGLDTTATTDYAFQIFNPFTGANNTTQRIMIQVSYSVSWEPLQTGTRGIWIQIVDDQGGFTNLARYGLATTDGSNQGNAQAGSTVIGLQVGESAAFFVSNSSNQTVDMLGGDITTNPLVTKFQTALIN
jgi:hypothetical protein